jgi:hypothetical protein
VKLLGREIGAKNYFVKQQRKTLSGKERVVNVN